MSIAKYAVQSVHVEQGISASLFPGESEAEVRVVRVCVKNKGASRQPETRKGSSMVTLSSKNNTDIWHFDAFQLSASENCARTERITLRDQGISWADECHAANTSQAFPGLCGQLHHRLGGFLSLCLVKSFPNVEYASQMLLFFVR